MRADALAGILAGLAVATPIGAIGSYLIGLAARTRFAVAVVAALGVATTDGCYALLAGLGIAGVDRVVGLLAGPLHLLAALLLVGLAIRTMVVALRRARVDDPATPLADVSSRTPPSRKAPSAEPQGTGDAVASAERAVHAGAVLRTYLTLVGLTAVNPSTIATFAAVVGGRRLTGSPLWLATAVFAVGAFVASGAWQLTLVGAGSVLGRVLSGRRGQLTVAGVSAAMMVALAVFTVSG